METKVTFHKIREIREKDIKRTAPITSLSEFVKKLYKVSGDNVEKGELYYRGESKDYKTTRLRPSVFREKAMDEYDYYYEMIRRFPGEYKDLSHISRLAKMQHYGLPTRMLDLTTNPLVALWFACESMENEDGLFYIITSTSKKNIKL